MIAGNARRHNQAKLAATSGISHFMSLRIPASEIHLTALENEEYKSLVIPLTELDSGKTFYEVIARVCCNSLGMVLPRNTLIVESTGKYMKGERVISSHTLTATVIHE